MATFTIGGTVATFTATIRGSQQEAGDIERVTFGVLVESEAEWSDFQSLVTTKYHVHAPLGGDAVIDIVRGSGEGTLVVGGFGSATAVCVGLRRSGWHRTNRTTGTADFLITVAWA